MTTGEPLRGDLLPCDELGWTLGNISSNQPLFTPQASWSINVGHCARICQAAHVVGRVLRHQNDHEMENSFRFSEAFQLYKTLVALDTLLQKPTISFQGPVYSDDALALCCSARFLLYDMYACNEDHDGDPIGLEEELQRASLEGIKETTERVYELSKRIKLSMLEKALPAGPLVIHCLYYAASECAWFFREDHVLRMQMAFQDIVDVLRLLQRRWQVAGEINLSSMWSQLTMSRRVPEATGA